MAREVSSRSRGTSWEEQGWPSESFGAHMVEAAEPLWSKLGAEIDFHKRVLTSFERLLPAQMQV